MDYSVPCGISYSRPKPNKDVLLKPELVTKWYSRAQVAWHQSLDNKLTANVTREERM